MSKALLPILCIVSLLAVAILQKGSLFLLLALLPSVTAYFIDLRVGKPTFKIVLACNFAATLPILVPMIKTGIGLQKPAPSIDVISDPTTWLFIYGGAAAGWALIFVCKMLAKLCVILSYKYRIATLERIQKRLIAEWGKDVQES